jgi:SAM-dependent methyltransferase
MMARTAPFEAHHRRYDDWFEHHAVVYLTELLAVRALLPSSGLGLSIGVGTARFAAPLGVRIGIDPARKMLTYARDRGVSTVQAVAEALPFTDSSFDYALAVTTICFVDDAAAMFEEIKRVLKQNGAVVIGFIDRTSSLGRHYQEHKDESVFYRDAAFFSADEVDHLLTETRFGARTWIQTLGRPLAEINDIEPLRPGYGEGAFVVVRAAKGAADIP